MAQFHNDRASFDMGSDSSCSSLHEIPMEMDLTAAGPPISDDETEAETKRTNKFLSLVRRIAPHFGLVGLLGAYLVMGAVVFLYIEGGNEKEQRDLELRTIFKLRDEFQDHIWNITQDAENRISREAFNSINQEYFESLVRNIFVSFRNQFINENHLVNQTQTQPLLWTFHNSIFFATTVITTIGYGNLVPTTYWGRVACIIFALFGIPLLLVTIADLGKFLSEFLRYIYIQYRKFKRNLRRKSRRTSLGHYMSSSQSQHSDQGSTKAGSMNLNDIDSDSELEPDEGLRIPLFMIAFVLLTYTAAGGFLFRFIQGLTYFEAFYFCFITMATVGFGDIVPAYHLEWHTYITIVYIICGLSLATMCIDLAGTEYLQKISYLGNKMENAKGAMITGIQVSENYIKQTGYEVFRTAGGKIVRVRTAMLGSQEISKAGFELILNDGHQKNILYEPLSANVAKLVKENNIKIMPDDITERDGYVVQNKSYNKRSDAERKLIRVSGNIIHREIVNKEGGRPFIVPCFVFKESDL